MTFLITAGPTREPLDPVRYLTNRSSGKMGYAIAEAAVHAGHRVILISGPTAIELPEGVDLVPVESAQQMQQAVAKWIDIAQVAIFAAAVADYRPTSYSTHKIKKTPDQETITVEFTKNPDILAEARSIHHFPGLCVGFAAETEQVLHHAQRKLARKGCDLILANDVSGADTGFEVDENEITAVFPDRHHSLGRHSKHHLGALIVELCQNEYRKKGH